LTYCSGESLKLCFYQPNLQAAEQEYEKEKLNERIAKLAGGVAVMQVLSSTWIAKFVLFVQRYYHRFSVVSMVDSCNSCLVLPDRWEHKQKLN